MMENPILISNINDFLFSPASIYFHNIFAEADTTMYQSSAQINGTAAHKTIDDKVYSKSNVLQSIDVYSEENS